MTAEDKKEKQFKIKFIDNYSIARGYGTSFVLYQEVVVKNGKSAGEVREQVVGYYSTVAQAVTKLSNVLTLDSFNSDEVALDEYVAKLKEVTGELNNIANITG